MGTSTEERLSTVSSLLMPELTINTVVSYPGVSGGGGGRGEGGNGSTVSSPTDARAHDK